MHTCEGCRTQPHLKSLEEEGGEALLEVRVEGRNRPAAVAASSLRSQRLASTPAGSRRFARTRRSMLARVVDKGR